MKLSKLVRGVDSEISNESSQRKLKILVVCNMYPGRNAQFFYRGIFIKEQVDALLAANLVECDYFFIDGHLGKFEYIKTIPGLLRRISSGGYDIVHAHYGISALFSLFLPFKRRGNLYLTLHGGDILADQGQFVQVALTKLILRMVARVIVVNDLMSRAVLPINKNVKVLPCGVDTDLFSPVADSRVKRFIFPGCPDRWVKNYDLFIKILDFYKAKFGDVEFVSLHNLSRLEIRDLMSSSSVLVMTSHSEGSPQVIKEALSCDIAIVSTAVGDVPGMLEATPGTAVFDKGWDVADICDLIFRVTSEAENTVGARRRRVFELGIDQQAVTRSLFEYYSESSV